MAAAYPRPRTHGVPTEYTLSNPTVLSHACLFIKRGKSGGGLPQVSGQCSSRGAGVWWAGLFPASAPPNMHTINPNDLPGNNTKSPWTAPFMVQALV